MYTSIFNMTTEYEYENMKNEFNQFGLITVGLLCVCVCGGGGGQCLRMAKPLVLSCPAAAT